MADAAKLAPVCKNGHGPMLLSTAQDGHPIPYAPGVDRGFAFVAYQCSVCAYREFHASTIALTPASEGAAPANKTGTEPGDPALLAE
jgi:hypothetical protein